MIVRESPKSKAPSKQPAWPPKSPHEALLSSPSGRKKYERRRDEGSPSPTPRRRPGSRAQHASEDEDEETLELQLKAIEARLKLKRLRESKARQAEGNEDSETLRATSRPGTSASGRRPELPRPQSTTQVPVSPVRNKRLLPDPKSPARVILGIDKGLRAQDVSLKRAASFHARSATPRDIPASLSRTSSRAGVNVEDLSTSAPRGKSFSERIAESRSDDRERHEKQRRIEKSRSQGFGLKDIEALRDRTHSRAPSSMSSGTIRSTDRNGRGVSALTKDTPISKSRSFADLKATSNSRPSSTMSGRSENSQAPSTSSFSSKSSSNILHNTKTSTAVTSPSDASSNRETTPSEPSSIFESVSGLHLTKRMIPHNTLTRTLDSKATFTIPQLLKIVKSPHYDPPDMENDYVVLGVIASKSSPLTPKNAQKVRSTGDKDEDSAPDKFMVIRLTDLKWELDLYLFDTGFSQFWKLTVGTVIAVLNPDIMPPRNRDTGKFSLKLTSSEDTVLEIGIARDLGFCKAMRKDGRECGQWVDGRKTEFCDFHVEIQVEKSKRGRMEVNTMTGFGKGPPGKHGMFGGAGRGSAPGRFQNNGLQKSQYGKSHDTNLHETYYIAPSSRTAAQLLDDDDDAMDRGVSRAELHRRRLAEKEKEMALAKRLGEIGSGAGGDYMRLKGAATSNVSSSKDGKPSAEPSTLSQERSNTLSTAAFDLLGGKKAEDVTLSPVKRKHNISGKSSEPMGWGGAFKRGLLEPKEPEQREQSPTKKRARFMLADKGLREPGRESLGGLDVGLIAAMDEEDDGLDII